jgi:hypothetical protein
MSDYGVTELSKMYNCTRNTIYSRLEEEELAQYVVNTKTGKKLSKEGLSVLNILMGDSKVVTLKTENKGQYEDKYINSLECQIDELKKEKEQLKDEVLDMRSKYDAVVKALLDNQQKLLEGDKKKKWFNFR